MTTARFHRDLYTPEALDEAARVYAPFADVARADDGSHFVVTVTAADPRRARRVVGELGNYALGLTVRARSGAARRA